MADRQRMDWLTGHNEQGAHCLTGPVEMAAWFGVSLLPLLRRMELGCLLLKPYRYDVATVAG